MNPTRGQIKTRFQALLDDPSGSVFNEPVFAEAFGEAFDALFTGFLTNQCPRIEQVATVTVPPLSTALTADQIGIPDFGGEIYIAERTLGSGDKYRNLQPVDRLPQGGMSDRLGFYNFRNDTFYFVGATTARELEIKYESSGEAPIDDTVKILVDGSLTFLANYAVGVAGGRKGYDEIAQRCLTLAVGRRYDDGVIGGELYRLIQPRVRSRQRIQIAPRRFSVYRNIGGRRAVPYVAAQQGTTGGGAQNVPIQYSSADGTIVGAINGTNDTFFIIVGVTQAIIFRNGALQMAGVNYSRTNNQITFLPASIPQTGDVISAEAYIA